MSSPAPSHVAHFYRHERDLGSVVAAHLAPAAGDALVLVSSPRHRDAILEALRRAGVDPTALDRDGRLFWRDAQQTLDALFVDGDLRADRFADVVRLIDAAVAAAPSGRVRVFGEMVSLLAADRRFAAVLELERLWRELADTRDMTLCCAFDGAAFGGQDSGALRAICRAHDEVLLAGSWRGVADPEDRQRLVELECALAAAERAPAADARQHIASVVEGVAQDLTRAFDSLGLAVFVLDAEGLVHRLNRAALGLTGWDGFGAVIGRPFASLGSDEPWITARSLAVDAAEGRASAVRAKTSERRWEVTASPLLAAGGGSIVTLQDTTELGRLQEALRRSESLADMGNLITGVAHEVRNPLAGISATLQLLESRARGRPEITECAALLQANVDRLMALMRELLDYARPAEPELADASLAAIVEESRRACAPLAAQRGVTVRSALPAELPPLSVDRRRLVQVFENVVANAVAFSPAGSTVTIRADDADDDVVCEVHDSGPGFTPEELPRVFEPFFSRRRDGTGLGLSIARRIVEAHGGAIEAANHPEGGAVIRIMLPRRSAAAAKA